MKSFSDGQLLQMAKKLEAGGRLGFDDGVALYKTGDITGLGMLADSVKQNKTGKRATYVVNRQINPTNICCFSCKFCSFSKKLNESGSYALTADEILSLCGRDITEVHITSALNPLWTFQDYMEIIRVIRKRFPEVCIKAYTAVEVDFFSRIENTTAEIIIERMVESGVDCLPGGGAEVFSERVRALLFPDKIGAERWLEIHKIAHESGLRSNATMLYGHIETIEERVRHLLALRKLQDETGGFLCFVPLAYQPVPSVALLPYKIPSAIDDLKNIAVSRLMLDNFDHIKAYWVTLGEDVASLALTFGADDLDGTLGEERIMHSAGAVSPVNLMKEKLIRLIKQSGFDPVERDGLYHH